MMDAEERLEEWARNRHYPAWEMPSPISVLQRLVEEGRDERLKKQRRSQRRLRMLVGKVSKGRMLDRIPCKESSGVRMEIVVVEGLATACPPDGGIGRMVERMAGAIDRSRRCREMDELFGTMAEDMRTVARVSYRDCASPRDVPRDPEASAGIIGCSLRTYFYRKKALLEWLSLRLYPGIRRAA